MKYVIIGNSIAAIGCIEGIRSRDCESRITVISSEPYHVYGRPLISYLLEGKTDLDRIKYRPTNFYKDNRCDLLLNKTATDIKVKEKNVVLSDGEKIKYDKLLIATGSRPFVPRIQGLDKFKYHTFMTIDDAINLEKELKDKKNANVLILGAGLIGLKCAEAILKIAGQITVVDMADRVLPNVLDNESALIIKRHLEEKGINFVLSTPANLDNFKFDLLCVCTGVIPNTNLALCCGAEIGRAIYINAKSETTVKDIYAAGDCTESLSSISQVRSAIPILPNAYIAGEVAGINMAGGNAENDKYIPMNAVGFFGKHILTAGIYKGEVYQHKTNNTFKKLFVENGKLNGFICIDDFKRAGIYTAMIRDQIDISNLNENTLISDPTLTSIYNKIKRDEIFKKERTIK